MSNSYYMVFGSTQTEKGEVYWLNRPIGVFSAPDALEAIKAAVKKHGSMSNMFAVEGVPYGIAFMDIEDSVTEFGNEANLDAGKLLAALQRQVNGPREISGQGDSARMQLEQGDEYAGNKSVNPQRRP